MKQFYLLVSFILVFTSQQATAQNDSIYFWKGGIKINQLSIKTADLDSINFKRTVAAIPTVTIGAQVWTIKNLDLATYSDGTPIPQVIEESKWEALTTGAWCYYNNDPANGAVYGKLYNWYAVAGIWNEASKTDASQRKKLAPTGYHVPSDTEWMTLTGYLGSNAGSKMKETGTIHWMTPNTDATNSSGFTGLPGSFRYFLGLFDKNIREAGFWWSSSEYNITNAWNTYLMYFADFVGRSPHYDKGDGLSVRCLRD
jgi:uncharacterized protein (TIGR02145 family)